MPRSTRAQLTRTTARYIARTLHPTVAPASSDIDKIVALLTAYTRLLDQSKRRTRKG